MTIKWILVALLASVPKVGFRQLRLFSIALKFALHAPAQTTCFLLCVALTGQLLEKACQKNSI